MVEVVGVRYRDAGHIYYFAPGDSEYIYNDKVLVESQQSLHIATVVLPKKEIDPNDLPEAIRPILHKASKAELEKDKKNNPCIQTEHRICIYCYLDHRFSRF